jgi:hypothetical protein
LKRKAQQQRNPGDSIGFARSLFWVSWIWVLLFVVGDLLQAETQGYGAKSVFGLVTLLAIGSGGFALEKTLISAREAKKHRPQTAQPSTSNRRSGKTETTVEGSIEEALPIQIHPPRRTIASAAKLPLRSQEGAGNGPSANLINRLHFRMQAGARS